MDKKIYILGFIIVGCMITLITSYLFWDARIDSVKYETTSTISKPNKEKTSTSDTDDSSKEDGEKTSETSLSEEDISLLTANMSNEMKGLVSSRLQTEESIQMLIVGSSSIENGNPGYGELLTSSIVESYGDLIETTTLTYDGTTSNLIEDIDGELIDWSKGYDIVLLEGMNLSNNGAVVVEDAIAHIESFNEKMKLNVEDSVLILHPSQPLARAIYYPIEVDAFKTYLTGRGYAYIDHWSNWPVGNEEEMNTYLTDDGTPNERGAAIWANSLTSYFTGNNGGQ